MKVCSAATLLVLILNYLSLAEGALSPPLNLSVELLDFKALVRWLPGPGNPKGTRYSVEFVDIENFSSSWNKLRNCTNITSKQCYLSLNQNILNEYFIKVRAKWGAENSEWTCLPKSIQPYKYTFLSAPTMSVLTERHSIQISLSHPIQSLMEVRMRFLVNLFQMKDNSAEKHIARNITPKSSSFANLPSGIYCINASAFLTAEEPKNTNATMCVSLHHDHKEEKVQVIILGVFLLLTLPATFALIIIIYIYVRPQRNRYKPKALIITVTGMSPTFNSEEHQAFLLSRIFIDEGTGSKHKTGENSSQGYFQRKGVHLGTGKNIKESLLSKNESYADQDPCTESDRYSTAAKMEERKTETDFRSYAPFKENFRTADSSESLGSDDVYESNYEPRPDPRYMFNL